eukprot:6214429-Pleurochrysis_carterae.AAC.1
MFLRSALPQARQKQVCIQHLPHVLDEFVSCTRCLGAPLPAAHPDQDLSTDTFSLCSNFRLHCRSIRIKATAPATHASTPLTTYAPLPHHDAGATAFLPSAATHSQALAVPCRPTLDCLFEDVSNDGETALKIWNAHAHTGVIGGFNVQGSKWSRQLRRFVSMPDPRMVELTLSPRDIAEPRFQGQSHSDDHPDDHGN